MNYLLPLLQWATVIIPGSWFFEAPGSSPRYQDDHDPSSWSRSVITKLLSRDTAGVITWLDWHTHPRTSHTNISHLRSVILSLFYSPGSGCLMSAATALPGPEKHRVLSKLNRIQYSGSEWKAWHWNVVGSWCGCWWIWINITTHSARHQPWEMRDEKWNEMEARPDPDFF